MFRTSTGYGHLDGNISRSFYSSSKAGVSRWLGKCFFLIPFWFSVGRTGVVEVWGTKSQKRPTDSEERVVAITMDESGCLSFGFRRRNNEAGSLPAPGAPTHSLSSLIDYMLHIYYIILNFDYRKHSASTIITPLTHICTVKIEVTLPSEELVTAYHNTRRDNS